MKFYIIYIIAAFFSIQTSVLDAVKPHTAEIKGVVQQKKLYTCIVHTDVVTDKPGKCPKCGRTLIEKKTKHVGNKNKTDSITNYQKMMKETTDVSNDRIMIDTALKSPKKY